VHEGIRQMFHVIEHARMAVGCKSMATLSTAYLNALEFTKIRVQGPDLLRATTRPRRGCASSSTPTCAGC
jgi:alkylation response protein AidB-like acyl-CoA dehydrogenase